MWSLRHLQFLCRKRTFLFPSLLPFLCILPDLLPVPGGLTVALIIQRDLQSGDIKYRQPCAIHISRIVAGIVIACPSVQRKPPEGSAPAAERTDLAQSALRTGQSSQMQIHNHFIVVNQHLYMPSVFYSAAIFIILKIGNKLLEIRQPCSLPS